jgi:hypothetical protein
MSKYDPWRDHLSRQHADNVIITFDELDALTPLPGSARTYRMVGE